MNFSIYQVYFFDKVKKLQYRLMDNGFINIISLVKVK